MEGKKADGKIHSFYVKAVSIPQAYYRVMEKVHTEGYCLRSQYDRRKKTGEFIDPPGKDTKFMIEVSEPFSQPRFPVLSYCERGKYIAEFLGAKNHLVVPHKDLLKIVKEKEEFEPTQWPYCYHQRLTAYPRSDGSTIDQLEIMLEKLERDPITRRAVAMTGVPEVDLFLKADMPCLREIQLRAIEDTNLNLVLNMHATWRSRDLFKAWGDNVIGITSLHARLAKQLEERMGRKAIVGPYTEASGSLHFYGQDYSQKGLDKFFSNFPTEESFIARARTSEEVKDSEIIPQLEELKKEKEWKFPQSAIDIIDNLIKEYKSGEFIP